MSKQIWNRELSSQSVSLVLTTVNDTVLNNKLGSNNGSDFLHPFINTCTVADLKKTLYVIKKTGLAQYCIYVYLTKQV